MGKLARLCRHEQGRERGARAAGEAGRRARTYSRLGAAGRGAAGPAAGWVPFARGCRETPGGGCLPGAVLYSAYFTLSQAADHGRCLGARGGGERGQRAVLVALGEPLPQAHWKADIAYSLMLVAST